MKNFVKAMDRNGYGFQYLKLKFPILSDGRIKEGIFVDPQIRELLKDEHFESVLNSLLLKARKSFKNVCERFLSNNRADNYKLVIGNLLQAYQKSQLQHVSKNTLPPFSFRRFPQQHWTC
jgi:hypothetical protein